MQRNSSPNSLFNILVPLALILGLVLLLNLDIENPTKEPVSANPVEVWVNPIVSYLAAGAEIAAAAIIGFGVFRSVFAYVSTLFSRSQRRFNTTESIRLRLGRTLVLGLEFTVAADILRTVVAPTRPDILNLATIVFLRTLLNYFLEQEIQEVEKRRQSSTEENQPPNQSIDI
ncbi:DUF1622 domain-containing protein [Aerosakkonemataceae cyanobacterium BLCC-F154]|uniref:DUF1622 domain-containing protein n=1 Tax=Floridaenema fluviatile BLCC-F154 TaxID=3153640 RepID=A0ABV4YI98_9CYAN